MPHGSTGMGGMTKLYGVASHKGIGHVSMDERAQAVHAKMYGLTG